MIQSLKKRHIPILAMLLTAMLETACSENSRPNNPEPIIRISEATDIMRTEATVKASIDGNDGNEFDYVELHYTESSSGPVDELTIEADPLQSEFEFHLTGLRPGASYSCHIEAGTSTALLKSDAITFTTIPNNPPTVSAITPLSTGPLGIMVRFSITDDGGEEILEAGCEVKERGSSESRRIYATTLSPLPEYLQLSITGLTPATSYSITPFASNPRGETRGETMEYTTSGSIILTESGMLSGLFGNEDNATLQSLVIAGPMNGDDFRTLRTMTGAGDMSNIRVRVSDIDLSDAVITEGGGPYDGQRFIANGRLTSGLFADCIRLRHAKLPNSATAIERDAFARCRALETLTIPALVETVLPSAGCSALEAIEVSEANTHFISDQGVLLNAEASEILWFPIGKTGEYRFPATISSIGENAFAGTSITTLIIPSTVTSISRGAFAESSLKEVILPDNMTNISEGMFQNCSSLTEVRLGTATDYIGDYVFDGTDLTDLYVGADYPPYAAPEAFTNRMKSLADECTLHVPAGTSRLYSGHKKWGIFKKIEEFQP